ncbi:hypothetical protein DSCA_55090 [Desulfosarcina alkanivorans]|uniref:Uncharacterized protein n=1 Tax=Desulfosarcina alkanivorans TaxID=571177 RepID=A0A5K7YU84_9BACT|nr:hypothetical protein DSCA_55090 [Desulfosarcina alkanivorans]
MNAATGAGRLPADMWHGDDPDGPQQPAFMPVALPAVAADIWAEALQQQHWLSHSAKVSTAARRGLADSAAVNTRQKTTASVEGRSEDRKHLMPATLK